MRISFALLASVVVASCTAIMGDDGDVSVRIHNVSAVDMDSVTVHFPGGAQRYGALAAGQLSGFAIVDRAYRYAPVDAWIGGEKWVLQPVDYVGERPLRSGHHTYGLTVEGAPPVLGFITADEYRRSNGTLFLVAATPASESMQALFDGRVIVDSAGCIRLHGPDPATVVWPHGFALVLEGAEQRIVDGQGRRIGTLGGNFRFGGGEVQDLPVLDHELRIAAHARCPGRFWIVGETN